MKLPVKTLKGQQFEVEVEQDWKVLDVKKAVEELKGKDSFPHEQLKLIHQGKVLKDDTTLQDNGVGEKSFVVVMVVQPRPGQGSSAAAPAAAASPSPQVSASASAPVAAAPAAPASQGLTPTAPAATPPAPAPVATGQRDLATDTAPAAAADETTAPAQPKAQPQAPVPAAAAQGEAPAAPGAGTGSGAATVSGASSEEYKEEQAASTLLAGAQLESTVQQILEMGGGGWDRPTVLRALRAAFNNPERAIDYLYSGIPDVAEVPPVSRDTAGVAQPSAPSSAGAPSAPAAAATAAGTAHAGAPGTAAGIPNVTPFNIFGPQPAAAAGGGGGGGGAGAGAQGEGAGPGALDFLRDNPQFQQLRSIVQSEPAYLQPMLQELAKQNPELLRRITQNQGEFMRLLREGPAEGELEQLAAAVAAAEGLQAATVTVTPEENEAIGRLTAMGFDRQLATEAFFACDKNEQLAANYLLEHGMEFED